MLPAERVSEESVGRAIFGSVIKSAPGVVPHVRVLAKAYGIRASADLERTMVNAIAKYTLALELVELKGLATGVAGERLSRVILDLAGQTLGSDFLEATEQIIDKACAPSARNVYGVASELLFRELGLADKQVDPRSSCTWIERWEDVFGGNTRIARVFLNILEWREGSWNTDYKVPYVRPDPIHGLDCLAEFRSAEGAGLLGVNPLRLLAVHMGNDQWTLRPSRYGMRVRPGAMRPEVLKDGSVLAFADPELLTNLRKKLSAHASNSRYVEMLFRAVDDQNIRLVNGPDLFPTTSLPGAPDHLGDARACVLREAKVGDSLFTYQPEQELSRFIAGLDEGAWSHVIKIGENGMAFDAQPGGLYEVRLDTYLTGKHRFAHCRSHSSLPVPHCRSVWFESANKRLIQSQCGMPYAWWGALLAGLHSWLYECPPKKHATPNALAYRGDLFPLTVW